jgi:hypothetical protein
LLIVHAAKTGRFSPWAYIILLLPGFGSAAYVLVELAPAWLGGYGGQKFQSKVGRALQPTKRYRQLADNLAITDTIANRADLAGECRVIGKHDEALSLYESILALHLGDEPNFAVGRAQALFDIGRSADAVTALDELKQKWPDYQSSSAHLLFARALEGAGATQRALDEYEAVSAYYPGAEPRVRQAALLMANGRTDAGRAIAQEVVQRLRRAPSHVRRAQAEWLATARKLA